MLEEKTELARKLAEKNEALVKQLGQLEASAKHSDSTTEGLKEIIETQKSRIQDLEQTFASSSSLANQQSEAAEQSRTQLLNIQASLQRQMDRMSSLEKINQQSLAKIDELQAAPATRKSSRRNFPEGHEDLSKINGVGPKFRQKLFDLGVKTVQEIASWSNEDAVSFAEKLGCGDRVTKKWSEKAAEMLRSGK